MCQSCVGWGTMMVTPMESLPKMKIFQYFQLKTEIFVKNPEMKIFLVKN